MAGIWGPRGGEAWLRKAAQMLPRGQAGCTGKGSHRKWGSQECPAPGHPLGLRGGESVGVGWGGATGCKENTPPQRKDTILRVLELVAGVPSYTDRSPATDRSAGCLPAFQAGVRMK